MFNRIFKNPKTSIVAVMLLLFFSVLLYTAKISVYGYCMLLVVVFCFLFAQDSIVQKILDVFISSKKPE